MAKKIKRYKVGMNSETYAISLVESPAIEEDFIALSKEEEKIDIKLSEDEKHIVYGAVLVPDRDIYRNNGKNEFYVSFSKESIEKMSQDFMKEYRQYEVKTDHDKVADEVCVVESWIKADLFKDKSVALGLNETLPLGTWFCGMKVNNIETWERIKSGELKGFSVESMISLEEFEKQNVNNMINVEEMSFWTKMKEVLGEVFNASSMQKEEEVELEEQPQVEAPQEPQVEPQPTEEPTVEEPVVEEPKNEEPPTEPTVEPQPTVDNHLEELINSLKEEVAALKSLNDGMNKKIKSLEKQPSVKPISTVGGNGGNGGNSQYSAWREQLRQML